MRGSLRQLFAALLGMRHVPTAGTPLGTPPALCTKARRPADEDTSLGFPVVQHGVPWIRVKRWPDRASQVTQRRIARRCRNILKRGGRV